MKHLDALKELAETVFDVLGDRIDDAPSSGISACGQPSENVRLEQSAYIKGLRSGRLYAVNLIEAKMRELEAKGV